MRRTTPRTQRHTSGEGCKSYAPYKQALELAAAERSAKAEKRALLLEAYEAKQRDGLVNGKSSEGLLAALKALD